jgi:hypothetical protein
MHARTHSTSSKPMTHLYMHAYTCTHARTRAAGPQRSYSNLVITLDIFSGPAINPEPQIPLSRWIWGGA